jgi:tripartite-type tricarboxylate transporter receptor subunit TctC
MRDDPNRSRTWRSAVLGACIALSPLPATAQDVYPSRLIKIVVPFPAGTTADAIPRIVAEKLTARWSQPIIVENRPGATGNIGAEIVAKADPDGYTLLSSAPPPLAINQSLYAKLGYDASKFVPISLMAVVPNVLVVNPNVRAGTLAELIALAKTKPDELSYGSTGPGGTPQLTMEMLKLDSGASFRDIPYRRGIAPALIDLLGGRLDAMFVNISDALPHIRAGTLRALGVTTERRIAELADVPAIAESFPGFYSATWYAMMAPPQTPPDIAAKLAAAVVETLKLPDVAGKLREQSMIVTASSPAETEAFIRQEIGRWRDVIVKAGIKPE